MLIFEDRPGLYTAKVADFGFSTYFHGDQDLIKMPKSEPWNAPEHHNRYFYPQGAKAMDVYSFGMLCLWLLFGVESSETMPYPLGTAHEAGSFSFEAQYWSKEGDLLLFWKRERLLEWAMRLVTKRRTIATKTMENLARFFQSSLSVNPQTRITDWNGLLRLLGPVR